jgi:hypothetical protein
VQFVDLGDQFLKNIIRSIRVYAAIAADTGAGQPNDRCSFA